MAETKDHDHHQSENMKFQESEVCKCILALRVTIRRSICLLLSDKLLRISAIGALLKTVERFITFVG
jgi:hypothetical protein